MMNDPAIRTTDALVLVHLRAAFYKSKYHLVLAVCALGLIMIAVLIAMLIYVMEHPLSPLYFVTDDAGQFIQEIPLQQPNMTPQEVTAWAVSAVESAYSYDYVNYHLQLQAAQKYFTEYGWRNYMKALDASNNLVALEERKQIVLAKVVGTPKIVAEGPLGKDAIYAWKLEMPVLVTYLMPPYNNVANTSKLENALEVSVLIMRQSILSSYKGLGVAQLVGTLAAAPPQTQLIAPSA